METCIIGVNEYLSRLTNQIGRDRKITTIVDASGVGMSNFSKKYLNIIMRITNDYFPETMYKTYIFPTHWTVKIAFGIAKLFLDKSTVKKFNFVNKADEAFVECDKKYYHEEYGGSLDFDYLNEMIDWTEILNAQSQSQAEDLKTDISSRPYNFNTQLNEYKISDFNIKYEV